MKNIIFAFAIAGLLLLPLQAFGVDAPGYPPVKAMWLKKNTEAKVRIPSFFKTHKGVLIRELKGENIRSTMPISISANSVAFEFPLGLDNVDASGKYVIRMAFCSEDATEISKDKCGKVLKKSVNYVKK